MRFGRIEVAMRGEGFAGLLLSPPDGDAGGAHARLTAHLSITGMREVAPRGWHEAEYASPVALLGEDRYEDRRPPFVYPLLCRIGNRRFLLLSRAREVVEQLIDRVWVGDHPPVAVKIGVDGLVRDLARQPGRYVLSYVHARVSAFGTSLEAASFYGEDVAEALFFRDGLGLFNCNSCGLRRAAGGPEIVRLSNAGAVSLRHLGILRLREIDELFLYLRKEGYVPTAHVVETDQETGAV